MDKILPETYTFNIKAMVLTGGYVGSNESSANEDYHIINGRSRESEATEGPRIH